MFPSGVIIPSSFGRTVDSVPISEASIPEVIQPYSDRNMTTASIVRVDPETVLQPNPIRSRPTFLNVPREIRDSIYRHLLLAKRNQIPQSDYLDFDTYDPETSLGTLTPASYAFHTAILATNRQIHNEALPILKANHFILVWSNYPLLAKYGLSIRTPLASRDNLLETITKFKHHLMSMDIFVTFPGGAITDYLKRMQLKRADCSFLIIAADLPDFRKAMYEHHLNLPRFLDSMTLTCKIRTGKIMPDIERALLEPLSHFRGFGKVIIGGNVTPAYARKLEGQMILQEVTFQDIIDAAYEKKEQGNQAAKRGDWEMAGRLWIRALNVISDGTKYHEDACVTATPEECEAVDKLYISAELNIMLGRLKCKDWRGAITDAQDLFKYYGGRLDNETKAKAYYRKGLAYDGLRIEGDAMWCFRKGLEFVPGDADCQRGVDGLEEKKRERERARERRRMEEELERKAAEEEEMRKMLERGKREKRARMKKLGKRPRKVKKAEEAKQGAQETAE